MDWSVHDLGDRPRVAILASKQGHCLGDLLVRSALGELPGEVAFVVVEPRRRIESSRRASACRTTSSPSATATREPQERALGDRCSPSRRRT